VPVSTHATIPFLDGWSSAPLHTRQLSSLSSRTLPVFDGPLVVVAVVVVVVVVVVPVCC
jgi:hypothetical protein